jgi:hypothetical protein
VTSSDGCDTKVFMRPFLTTSALVLFAVCVGCAGSPVAPFDSFKSAPITAYRLQNYEPAPQPVAAAATGTAATSLIPGVPAEIQKWVQAGASMLPPGLIPPGLIPGATAATTTPTAQADTAQRFNGFRIIAMPVNVTDQKQRDELINIFGFEKNFDNTHGNCVYAEFGFSFARIQQAPADVLVSMSCDQVEARNFIWPHKSTGLTPDSVNRLTKLAQTLFGGA